MKVTLILCAVFGFASCSYDMFFHAPTRLKPPGNVNQSDFGFSMGFQNSYPPRLVVGAPRQDYIGKVYTCPLSDLSKEIDCSEVDMKFVNKETSKNKEYRLDISPDQYLYFGSSIAATPDNFLTCAPLMIKRIASNTDAYGSCYVYDNKESTFRQFKDNGIKLSKKLTKNITTADIGAGGLGWNSLVDEKNGRLIIAKTAMLGDIDYIDIKNLLGTSKSLVEQTVEKNILQDFWNFGYGLTVGNFFDKSTSLYAVSFRGANLKGSILFLKEIEDRRLDIIFCEANTFQSEPCTISNEKLGSMFGYALAAGDFNEDGLSELIVGAPAQTDDTRKREPGALHIYVGGNLLSRNDKKRMRTIVGTKHGSRFGSALATSDIDGDNIPELFVSAPYQYSESGVVYVISGYEVRNTLLAEEGFKRILLTELVLTQELRSSGSRHLGFSLQVVQDLDDNGCNELAVGSPGNNSVLLYRCLPAVTTNISLDLFGDKIVNENAESFDVNVCVNVTINQKATKKPVHGYIKVKFSVIKVKNSIDKPFAEELESDFKFGLSEKRYCKKITVNIHKSEKNEYKFSTELKLERGGDGKTDYEQWAVLSPYSELHKTIRVLRTCNTEAECRPDFKMELTWLSGDPVYDFTSTTEESVKISVTNDGHDADGDVELIVQGARISTLKNQCVRNGNMGSPLRNYYLCSLPKPLKRGSTFSIIISLNKTEPTNARELAVKGQIISRVGGPYKPISVGKPVKIDPTPVLIKGISHNFNVTDKDLENSGFSKYTDNHEYYIHNTGPITWVNLNAELFITKQPFIQHVKLITIESCEENTLKVKTKYYVFNCKLNLKPNSTASIVTSIEISKEKIGQSITSGKLYTNSTMSIRLEPTDVLRSKSLTTEILYQKILTVGNNFLMIISIGVVVAVFIIIALTLALYKCGFFKRAEKKRLESLRESVRKRSVRLASESSKSRKSAADEDHMDIEVFDDNEHFTPLPHSSKDDTVLIEGTTERQC